MKHHFLSRIFCVLALTAVFTAAHAQKTGRDRVLKIDAVALIDHCKEIEGKVEFQQQHGRYLYLFANDDSLTTFKANPAKYEIQLGGACGRMGPLSGEGSPKIFAVNNGRLFIFASEQCKRAFTAAPEKFLEVDDPKPAVTDESQRRGRVIVDMIAAHSGMLRQTGRLATVREQLTHTETSGDKTYTITNTITLLLPDGVRYDSCWNADCWGYVASGEAGWMIDSGGAEMKVDSQRQALLRGAGRHPWLLVSQRDQPGFIAVNNGERRALKIEGQCDVEGSIVVVPYAGATTTMGVDDAGRVRLVTCRGRGPGSTIGDFERIFSDFHDAGGYELPGRIEVSFNGKPAPTLSGKYTEQVVNDPVDKARFDRPDALTQ
jgi:YHS domain-containing protein